MFAQIRELLAETMRRVVEKVTGNELKTEEVLDNRAELSQHECYKAVVNHYKHYCYNWHKPEVESQSTSPSQLLKSRDYVSVPKPSQARDPSSSLIKNVL